jgi:PilZ domain
MLSTPQHAADPFSHPTTPQPIAIADHDPTTRLTRSATVSVFLHILSFLLADLWEFSSQSIRYDTQQRNERMRRERRKYLRVESSSAARIFYGELVRPCIVSNLSNGGARITGVRAYTFPREFMLRATPHGRIRKCHVLWRTDDALGVRFVDWDTGVATPIAASTVQEPSS